MFIAIGTGTAIGTRVFSVYSSVCSQLRSGQGEDQDTAQGIELIGTRVFTAIGTGTQLCCCPDRCPDKGTISGDIGDTKRDFSSI